jgi:transcriptional regulator with GAF, ATPase, and Fis domain
LQPLPDHLSATYQGTDISDQLAVRPGADDPAHLQAARLVALARRIAEQPHDALQALVDLAMKATSAHAAGLSLSQQHHGDEVFRWVATTGDLADQLGATMPRWFSPCGDVLRKNVVTLMRSPVKHYPYISQLDMPIHEVLLAPFSVDGEPLGTVWAVSRDASKSFHLHDAQTLTELAAFVSDSTVVLERLRFGNTH